MLVAKLLTNTPEITIMIASKQERVNTLLFGKFCIDFGSAQSYQTEHCVEPDQSLFERQGYYYQKLLM